MNNDEYHKKQLTLNFNVVRSHNTKASVIDFKTVQKNKESSKKGKAISALLKEAERLTW